MPLRCRIFELGSSAATGGSMSVHSAAEIDALWWRFYKSRDAISVRARMIVADKYDGNYTLDSLADLG
jgi:hypothetical protein